MTISDPRILAALAARDAHDAQGEPLQTKYAKMQSIVADEARAKEAFDSIGAKYKSAMKAWIEAGCEGDAPVPDTKASAAAQQALITASARADVARSTMRELEAQNAEIARGREKYNAAVDAAVASCLCEKHGAQQRELMELEDRRDALRALSAQTWREAQRRHPGIASDAAAAADQARVEWMNRRHAEITAAIDRQWGEIAQTIPA